MKSSVILSILPESKSLFLFIYLFIIILLFHIRIEKSFPARCVICLLTYLPTPSYLFCYLLSCIYSPCAHCRTSRRLGDAVTPGKYAGPRYIRRYILYISKTHIIPQRISGPFTTAMHAYIPSLGRYI